jgi:hypothetical protein
MHPAPKLANTVDIYIALHKSQGLFLQRNMTVPQARRLNALAIGLP